VTSEIDLSKLAVAEKDDLILTLLPLVGQLEAALVRIAELEKRLAAFERPPKTPDNSSLPPSKGQKADRPAGDKPPRRSRPGFGRALEPNPDRTVDGRLDSCPHCAAGFAAESYGSRRSSLPIVPFVSVTGQRAVISARRSTQRHRFTLLRSRSGPPRTRDRSSAIALR
jgi:transposase